VSSVDANGVQLTDGTALSPDAIIAATGFRTGLEPLVGHLGVLDDQGAPRTDDRGVPRGSDGTAIAPGLYFLGYDGDVGVIGARAHRATKQLCRELVRKSRTS